MGYEGDPVYDQHLANPNAPKRPWWTKNGSLMAFRNLEQDVFGFEAFLNERAPYWKEHTPVSTEVQPPFKNDQGLSKKTALAATKDVTGDRYALLQRKVEELERLHMEAKQSVRQ